jgi:arsenate reductase
MIDRMSDRPAAPADSTPTVLFLCVHNAGRSQMAAGWMRHLATDRVNVLSAGSEPTDQVNPVAVAAMAEKGIDIGAQQPRRWSDDSIRAADVVVTMGCGDECPVYPGRRYVDWELSDPAGLPLDEVRPIRDEIEDRVRTLLSELDVEALTS